MFRSAGDTGSAGKDYLILSTPEFEEAVRRLADWKRTLGFGVHTRLRGDWTPERIKSAVKEVYRSAPSLYYLLIVGDQTMCRRKIWHGLSSIRTVESAAINM